ncbi:hypothetical protein JKF63_03365 [Porcisia hertigi]|uniref:Uncharacterized protein n=1 Tax=Porcisia hertigi TaxID=2761500 RepID=A0A836IN06_9TRYP|nr:hypothetical protein JKF63_03365 [Porcisia hertigi]
MCPRLLTSASAVVCVSLTSTVSRRGGNSYLRGAARTPRATANNQAAVPPPFLDGCFQCAHDSEGSARSSLINCVSLMSASRGYSSPAFRRSCSRSAASSIVLSLSFPSCYAGSATAARTLRRGFYSGLDESRVHRLRRSGMTFNRPRGRDMFSAAFESRLRIVPLTQMSDLYGPIDISLLTAVNAEDPTSSKGNVLEHKKYMAGDALMRKVVERKQRAEATLHEKRDWHVLVVDPIEPRMAGASVPFPSAHPAYYLDWVAAEGKPPPSSCVLERRLTAEFGLPLANAEADVADAGTGAAVAAHTPTAETHAFFYTPANRRHLQQNGDTTLLSASQVRQTTLSIPNPLSTSAQPLPSSSHTIRQHIHTAVCIDPDISHGRFQREEAQVEMISAYRNILYEAAELGHTLSASSSAGGSLQRTMATQRKGPFVADVVRVPALCHYSCGQRFLHELGKLNQQSVIKGFHRLSNEAKELLIMNRSFTVEIYVPPMLLGQFEHAFLEEPWEVPLSTLNPGRTALYPGLAPPPALLQYDGWIGKRPELVEGIATKGRSLLRGGKVGLDGQLIEEREVLASLRVFGALEEQQKMLEGERKTAAEQLGAPLQPTYAPLLAGLQTEAEHHPGDEVAENPFRSCVNDAPAAVAATTTENVK